MGTWIKETGKAIYLMEGGYWISRLTKYPSRTNPAEQVLNISAIRSWFLRDDYPRAMTVSLNSPTEPLKKTILPPPPPPPPPVGKINADGLRIIKHFEGLELTAYRDPVGIWTIGYGHTSEAGPPTVYQGLRITAAEAEEILRRDLGIFERGVQNAVLVPLNGNQFSALVSFAFNVGVGALERSTLLAVLNERDYAGAADQLLRWVTDGVRPLPGLVRRRDAERALFLGQDYTVFL